MSSKPMAALLALCLSSSAMAVENGSPTTPNVMPRAKNPSWEAR